MKKGLVLVLLAFMVLVVSGFAFGGKPYVPKGFVPKGWDPSDSNAPVLTGPISTCKMLTLGLNLHILEENLLAVVYNGKDSKGMENWKIENLPKGTEIMVKRDGNGNIIRYKRKCGNIFFPHDEGFKKDPRLPASKGDVECLIGGLEKRIDNRLDSMEGHIIAEIRAGIKKLLRNDNWQFIALGILFLLGLATFLLIIIFRRRTPRTQT